MTVYLLHFETKIAPETHTTQHYIGYAGDVDKRLASHKNRPDARLVQVAKERGIGFGLARTWEGDRKRERQIKNWKMGPRLCPICQGKVEYKEWEEAA